VSNFCPDGYLSIPNAIVKAAEHWFTEQLNELEMTGDSGAQPEAKPESPIDAAVRAFSLPQLPDVWRHAFKKIASQTTHRLRNLLHQGKLVGYYFDNDGRHAVPREFWATAQADRVLESGVYWAFGEPSHLHEQRPHFPLMVLQSDLDLLLSEQLSKKGPFPRSKMPDLIAALRQLDDLPNRAAQLQALRDSPEFRKYMITTPIFREAAKHLPRDPGRKPHRKS
jgi:hypothetical protein